MTESPATSTDESAEKSKADKPRSRWTRSIGLRYTSHTLYVMNVLAALLLIVAALMGKYLLRQIEDLDYELSGASKIFLAMPLWMIVAGAILLAVILTVKEFFIKNRAVTLMIEIVVCVILSALILGYGYVVIIGPILAAMQQAQEGL